MENQKIRIIAFYLPQFHPIPENDLWYGKGFTEWTNVGKAKPLYKGHYQPKVPADLGYYDLRLPEARMAQAEMAKEYGIEGFMYWHYWFGNGKQLLETPFNEVLKSGKPDLPFCLGWANHSWFDKQWKINGTDKLLIEQLYPGDDDHIAHFNTLLPAFNDSRYIRVNNKPIFMVHSMFDIPNVEHFIELWQSLAIKSGLEGIHFVGRTDDMSKISTLKNLGADAVNTNRLRSFYTKELSLLQRAYGKIARVVFKHGLFFDYGLAMRYFTGTEDKQIDVYPSIIPNYDHSPRSGRSRHNFKNSTPEKFKWHITQTFANIIDKPHENRVVFLTSWNEWAEGNYIEPDLKFGRGYLEALKDVLNGL